jgi:hypothetical protein
VRLANGRSHDTAHKKPTQNAIAATICTKEPVHR